MGQLVSHEGALSSDKLMVSKLGHKGITQSCNWPMSGALGFRYRRSSIVRSRVFMFYVHAMARGLETAQQGFRSAGWGLFLPKLAISVEFQVLGCLSPLAHPGEELWQVLTAIATLVSPHLRNFLFNLSNRIRRPSHVSIRRRMGKSLRRSISV